MFGHDDEGMNVEPVPLTGCFDGIQDPTAGSFLPEQRPTVHTRVGQIVAVARFVVSFSTFPVAVGHGDSLPNSARPDKTGRGTREKTTEDSI